MTPAGVELASQLYEEKNSSLRKCIAAEFKRN